MLRWSLATWLRGVAAVFAVGAVAVAWFGENGTTCIDYAYPRPGRCFTDTAWSSLPDHWLAGSLVLVSLAVALLPWFGGRVRWRLWAWAALLALIWVGFFPGDPFLLPAALVAVAAAVTAGVATGSGG